MAYLTNVLKAFRLVSSRKDKETGEYKMMEFTQYSYFSINNMVKNWVFPIKYVQYFGGQHQFHIMIEEPNELIDFLVKEKYIEDITKADLWNVDQ